MPAIMYASTVQPATDWFYSLIWSAVATGAPAFAIILFVPAILTHSTARSVLAAFAVIYLGALSFSILVITLKMTTAASGVLVYPTALSQIALSYLFARIVNDIAKGTYDPFWFVRLYYRLASRYLGSTDPNEQPAQTMYDEETDGIDEVDSISPAHAPVAAFRGRHAAPVSVSPNRSAA